MEKIHCSVFCKQYSSTEVRKELEAKVQKIATTDKYCQTEHQEGCCEPAANVSVGTGPKTAVLLSEPGDPPLLQQQLQTSKSGIQQIIECFRSGTTQLKHILLKEVDTIFECKLCRSLFRGLPNLITHKEFYCFPRKPDAADPPAEDTQSQAIRDLLEAIYPQKDRQEYVVKLDPIETNQNAVFQCLTKKEEEEEEKLTSQPAPEDTGPNEQPSDAPEGEESHPVPEAASKQEAGLQAEIEEEVEEEEEEAEGLTEPVEIEVEFSEEDGYKFCCLFCRRKFSSRRSVRFHCNRMHKKRMDELRMLNKSHTSPISLFRTAKCSTLSRSCPVCCKNFATKANVRRHFDEVHRGLRRDSITPDIATKPGQPLSLESPHKQKPIPQAQYNVVACKCLICKRQFSSRVMLRRHLRIVHKINMENGSAPTSPSSTLNKDKNLYNAASSCLSPSSQSKQDKKGPPLTPKSKDKQGNEVPKSPKVGKMSMCFDFKSLYCKLCKRQFSNKENLTKHIDMHTDGNDLFIKFYRCPNCEYDSRRKRDVIRHITVVHKKTARYLVSIIPKLESLAVMKPAEVVLNRVEKRGATREDANSQHGPSPGSPVTRRQEALNASGEVTHKRTTTMGSSGRTKGRSTRSKSFIWYVSVSIRGHDQGFGL